MSADSPTPAQGLREGAGNGVTPQKRGVARSQCWVKKWGRVLLARGTLLSKGQAVGESTSTAPTGRPVTPEHSAGREGGCTGLAWPCRLGLHPDSSREPGKGCKQGRAVAWSFQQ